MKQPNQLTISDYRKAIQKMRPTAKQAAILEIHANMKIASLSQIAVAIGTPMGTNNKFDARGVASSYGRFARKIGMILDNSPKRPNEKHYWMELLCAVSPNKGPNGATSWIIRERFVKALKDEKVI